MLSPPWQLTGIVQELRLCSQADLGTDTSLCDCSQWQLPKMAAPLHPIIPQALLAM